MTTELLRLYLPTERVDGKGYPLSWSRCQVCAGTGEALDCCPGAIEDCGSCEGAGSIKLMVRARAGHRCVRCGHPYRTGESPPEWSPCDPACTHGGPVRWRHPTQLEWQLIEGDVLDEFREDLDLGRVLAEARYRILTVHHLNGNKRDCRWWNLVALCQRDHLYMQGKVILERPYLLEHSEWFKPYAAGFYASKYLGQEITRDEAVARQAELLAFEAGAA